MDTLGFFGLAFIAIFLGKRDIDDKDYSYAAVYFALSLIAGMAGVATMVAHAIK